MVAGLFDHYERTDWQMYAFDPSERAVNGRRSRQWTAVASTELGVVREMAHCLREIGEGRAPKWIGDARRAPLLRGCGTRSSIAARAVEAGMRGREAWTGFRLVCGSFTS